MKENNMSSMKIIDADSHEFLEELTISTVNACRVEAGNGSKNALPFTAIFPGGRGCYPAIWIQDFTMIFASGLVSEQEGLEHLRLILRCQNGESARHLKSNAVIPPYAIPDHINIDGSPVFYPGTYSSGENQGGEPWGFVPPTNNHYDVIWLTEMLTHKLKASELLKEDVAGMSVYERLKRAFDVPTADPETGMVTTTPEHRAVGFIFCDSIYMTGDLLMASLLRYRAATHLAVFADKLGKEQDKQEYLRIARLIQANIVHIFADIPRYGGWLKASTGFSGQPDVWGTIYSVYIGALQGDDRKRVMQTIVNAIEIGQIESEGGLRHVPLNYDASESAVWEKTPTAKNRYQNGAYWHMPAGWLISALQMDYPDTAKAVFDRYIKHMRENSFTKGSGYGAPWECFGWGGAANQNAIFGPSISMLYGIIMKQC